MKSWVRTTTTPWELGLIHPGPLIRIGPNELSFYSLEVYDTIHKAGTKFTKDPRTYGEFVQDGHPALFSITCVSTVLIHDSPAQAS